MRFFCLFLGALGGIAACGGSTSDDGSAGGASSGGASSGGSVSTGGNVSSGGSAPCTKLCDGVCVAMNVATGCGAASCEPCNLPHASATCSPTGECEIAACDDGYSDCDQGTLVHNFTGCESNIDSDPNNCGGCGVGCTAEPGSQASCVEGNCAAGCPLGFGSCGTGFCDTPLDTPEHCGSCGKQCSNVHATPACLPTPGGIYVCKLTCADGYQDCDLIEDNGCETLGSTCTGGN